MPTEKEKCLAGLLYDATSDPQLLADRDRRHALCFEYNHLSPSRPEERSALLRQLFRQTGHTFLIEPPFFCDYGYNIELDENFYANFHCTILDAAPVSFGNNVFIAPGCRFYTAEHPLDAVQRNQGLEYTRPITIGHNVWIGAQSIILAGVRIGNNTVVGAGSVVTHDLPDHVVVVGNPCRILKKIRGEGR